MKIKDILNEEIEGMVNAPELDYFIDTNEYDLLVFNQDREIESIYYDIDFECIIVLLKEI